MASEEDPLNSITLKGTLISDIKLNDLKKELDKRGLSKGGSRAQLNDRLKAQLLLEKLQQDAALSSGDELEGKAPNIAMQDEKTGQNEFVRQYLQQQQRNLEIQMEVKKQVEEERKRKSADESSADEAINKKTKVGEADKPDVTSPKKFKDDSSNAPAKESKMPRPARKSSRNSSKPLNENGQEVDVSIKDRSRSPTPEKERLRERTRSGSTSRPTADEKGVEATKDGSSTEIEGEDKAVDAKKKSKRPRRNRGRATKEESSSESEDEDKAVDGKKNSKRPRRNRGRATKEESSTENESEGKAVDGKKKSKLPPKKGGRATKEESSTASEAEDKADVKNNSKRPHKKGGEATKEESSTESEGEDKAEDMKNNSKLPQRKGSEANKDTKDESSTESEGEDKAVDGKKNYKRPRGKADEATKEESSTESEGEDKAVDGKKNAELPPRKLQCTDEIKNNNVGENTLAKKVDDNESISKTEIAKESVEEKEAVKDSEPPQDTAEQGEKMKKEKKRKWGSKTSKAAKVTKKSASLEISSESMKGLIGEVKLTETVFDMETEDVNELDYEPEEDQRDIKMKKLADVDQEEKENISNEMNCDSDARTVEAREESPKEDSIPPEENTKKIIRVTKADPKEGKKSKEGKKKKKKEDKEKDSDSKITISKDRIIATSRPAKALLTPLDEPEPASTDSQSPARNPVDRVVRIACLVRPFTVNQLKELLRRNGDLDDEYFWINDIKSHCLAAFKNEEDAVKARKTLHGARWPQSNPKILVVDYATIEDIEHRKAEASGGPLIVKKSNEQIPKQDPKELEERRKARELREKERLEKEKGAREKRDSERQKKKQNEKNDPPMREWDRDKVQQLSRSRSPEDRTRRSRSRDKQKRRDSSKRDEDRRKERKQKENKSEEEPPAKLLDDLFRKTKAAPCIYWLPLTEEQSEQRALKKQEEEKEREKRKAALEEKQKEEQKKEMKRREERLKEREKEREREREKARERMRQRDRSRERNRERTRQDRGRSSRGRSSSSRSRSRSRSRRRR